MKQLRNLFGSMLAVLAVAMMMTACNDVADNPTVPASLTVTETNGIKVTKLILTSVGTNNVYDLTPYITDKDGMSSFSCDQIFIEADANDLYYDVYAEDAKGNKYATNVYLNMVRGQQNTLEVTLKQTYAAQTLLDLATALNTYPAKKGAVVTFVFADGSKITYKPALVENAPLPLVEVADEDADEDASQEEYTWYGELKPELSGPMFDAMKNVIKDMKLQEEGMTLADAFSFYGSTWSENKYVNLRLNISNILDNDYYNGQGAQTYEEQEARRKARKAAEQLCNFEVRYQVDEEKGDWYRVKSYNGLEVPQIIYKKDANSEEGEVKVLRDITEEYNKVSFKFIAPEADDEVWSEIVKRNPEGAKFLTETDFTFKYPEVDYDYQWASLSGDDWSFRKFNIYDEVQIKENVYLHDVIGYWISCKIGDQTLSRWFFLHEKNTDGEYVLVNAGEAIDPEGDYILREWEEPADEEPVDEIEQG
jgi:hypothetical protein